MIFFKKIFSTQRHRGTEFFFVHLSFCVLFLISCSKKEEKIPPDIIQKEKMVQILVDVHLAEAQSQLRIGFDDSRNLKQSYYKFIFDKYQISYSQFSKSFDYYSTHPGIFSEVYDDVITELSKKQAETSKK